MLAASCSSEPDPSDPMERARASVERRKAAEARMSERRRAEDEAALRRSRPGAASATAVVGLELPHEAAPEPGVLGTATPSGPWKRELLGRYAARLTPLQRSALLAARIGSYAQGEALCEGWVEENRQFESGEAKQAGQQAGEASAGGSAGAGAEKR